MKKILFIFSMLLAMGLTSACSTDDENPFVGEWQLEEIRNVMGGEITYPTDEDDGSIRIDHVKFLPNFEYIRYSSSRPELDFPAMTYSYDNDILTLKNDWGYYLSKYRFIENGKILILINYSAPGFVTPPMTISTFKRIK